MISPLENRFQKTSLEKDSVLGVWKAWKRSSLREQEMPEGRTNIWVSWSKNTDRTQATPKPFQVVLNLLLKTALKRELLSFGRQFALSMAMDQKTSSFSTAFQRRERIFFLPRIYKTPVPGGDWSHGQKCRNLCAGLIFLLLSLLQLITTLLLTETPHQQRWQEHSPALTQVQPPSLNRLLQYFKSYDYRRLIRPTLPAHVLYVQTHGARYKVLH